MNTTASEAISISSLIVGAQPAKAAAVRASLGTLAGVEVHAVTEDGRMIVTVEAASDDATVQAFETIRRLPGVLSAAMVYHRYESDPDGEV
ncbi:MAG: uncharacterized protein H6R10_2354 [Rhodocyclaceae bacterium]|nr:uncharacterized protein [Rhodocyclaceae bacterium]